MQAAQTHTKPSSLSSRRSSDHKTKDELLLLATRRYCDIDTHCRLSRGEFLQSFNLLIDKVSFSTRQIVARTLAHSHFAPRSIVLYLAMEPLEIALPILSHSPALGQLDMLRIADKLGSEHATVIAARPDIGPSLVKHLEQMNDADVQTTLTENKTLFVSAEARSANAMFEEIETRNHAPIKSKSSGSENLTGSADELNSAEKALLVAASRGGRSVLPDHEESARRPMAREMENSFDFGTAFEKMARTRSHQGMAVLMQKRFNLSLDTAYQVLQDETGDTLAVLLCAADVNAARANRIQLLANPAIGLSSTNAQRAVEFYAQLDSQNCRIAVDLWPKAKDPSIQHEPHLAEGHRSRHEDRDAYQRLSGERTEIRATG